MNRPAAGFEPFWRYVEPPHAEPAAVFPGETTPTKRAPMVALTVRSRPAADIGASAVSWHPRLAQLPATRVAPSMAPVQSGPPVPPVPLLPPVPGPEPRSEGSQVPGQPIPHRDFTRAPR